MVKIIVETSARHVHISQEHLKQLFGKGYQLSRLHDLSQSAEFAAKEQVIVKTDKNSFNNVRIVGPVRGQTQVEISQTDANFLGLIPPIRRSGDLAGSEQCILIGPQGQVVLREGVIISKRHIHINPQSLSKFGLKAGQTVSVKIDQKERGLIFNNVDVRVEDKFSPAMHVDTDEANAAGIDGAGRGEITV
ncbi:MAG: phosphate propanoyltransferase [Candidatus Parcubacteria bacterium]|nr:phosphate propanoyltransferase [Candidatus Parcubacteria bacterium]